MAEHKPIVVTPGEPAGIGPDLALALAIRPLPVPLVAIADSNLLRQRASVLGLAVRLSPFDPEAPPQQHQPGLLPVQHVDLRQAVNCGRTDPANAGYVLDTIREAVAGCIEKRFHALVTGPVHKACIVDAGIRFSGHTEFLGELTGAAPVMMLANDRLRVALVTTHLPLAEVSRAITASRLQDAIEILHRDLQRLYHIEKPRIAVTGLNPHAGESGHLGREEIDVIEPVILRLQQRGFHLRGPLPADTAFTHQQLALCDAVLAMYHDQGLPVVKHAGFGETVNITLGLPIIRTSVDHGTALELAGSGRADSGSLHAAFLTAAKLHA